MVVTRYSLAEIKNIIKVRYHVCKMNIYETVFEELINSIDENDFLFVFKKYFYTILTSDILKQDELIEWFTVESLNANHIYTCGKHEIVLNGNQKADIRTLANSQATIKTLENSQATVETWANSQATVETRENSQATIKTRENSQATVETLENSQATVETLENSQATVETWANSQATIKTRANSQATVETWANSQATYNCIGGLVRDHSKKKIFIKKSEHEIVIIP